MSPDHTILASRTGHDSIGGPRPMVYLAITGCFILHALYWGAGLAALITPAKLRPWWWVFAPSCGIALQSLTVWIGVHAGWPGTNSYAWPSELIPLLLLLLAIGQRRLGLRKDWLSLGRLTAITLAVGLLLVVPMARSGSGLQTMSLGSCDHADYAAGARAMAEFARDDTDGFLGQKELIRTGSTDNFFDFWIRLNHFAPAALLAHHSSLFGVEIYRLASTFAASLLLLNLPLVWFLARLVTGLRGWRAWLVVTLYGVSPLGQYGVHNGALGQLLAANGLTLLLVLTVWMYKTATGWGRAWGCLPLLVTANWVLIGGYHFILVVSLAQAGAWLVAMLWLRRDWLRFRRTLTVMLGSLLLCGLVFSERLHAIVERFALFEQNDFGWKIPVLTFEGWLGLVRNAELQGWSPVWRVLLAGGVIALWAWALVLLWRRQRRQAVTLVALILPIAIGWTILSWESLQRDHATYDAYKLLAVFHPGLLAGFCGGLALAAGPRQRAWIAALVVAVVAGNFISAADFARRISHPNLRTDRHLAALGELEQRAQITGINIQLDDWERLWANYFLLRKRQYFAVPTYEGRNVTAPEGNWSLYSMPIRILPPRADDAIILNDVYYAVRANVVPLISAKRGPGWHRRERFGSVVWRWAGAKGGVIYLHNQSKSPVSVRVRVKVAGAEVGRRLVMRHLKKVLHQENLAKRMQWSGKAKLVLPSGVSWIQLGTLGPAAPGGVDDTRLLTVAVTTIEIQRVLNSDEGGKAPTRD